MSNRTKAVIGLIGAIFMTMVVLFIVATWESDNTKATKLVFTGMILAAPLIGAVIILVYSWDKDVEEEARLRFERGPSKSRFIGPSEYDYTRLLKED